MAEQAPKFRPAEFVQDDARESAGTATGGHSSAGRTVTVRRYDLKRPVVVSSAGLKDSAGGPRLSVEDAARAASVDICNRFSMRHYEADITYWIARHFAPLAQRLADTEQANRIAADDLAQMTARAEMAEKALAEAWEKLERAKLEAAWGEKLRG